MKRLYFGTDGVRGPYGGPVVNERFAYRLGVAAGRWLSRARERSRVGIQPPLPMGRDTRFSGESLESALAAGLASEGWKTAPLGVVPTPAVACAVRTSAASLGIVVTASHNPAGDNGIKFFGAGGLKLTDEKE
jgi:phosphoglucosamine mutase